MSANLRRYRARDATIAHRGPAAMSGRPRRHLRTLAALIRGIGGSRHCQRAQLAAKVPRSARPERRVNRCVRGLASDAITPQIGCLSGAATLRARRAQPDTRIVASIIPHACVKRLVSIRGDEQHSAGTRINGLRPNGRPISRAAPIDRDNSRAESNFQKRSDLARR